MAKIKNPKVAKVFDGYPKPFRSKMMNLRNLVLQVAKELELDDLEETLKWGEPSYLTKHGSTIRMDWKEKNPDQYAIYFKCTSKLVETFQKVYPDTFSYETTRAIVFQLKDKVPTKELKHCVKLALTYHKVKHLPNLGAKT